LRGLLEHVLAASGEDDRPAVLQQDERRVPADAAACAGDDRDLRVRHGDLPPRGSPLDADSYHAERPGWARTSAPPLGDVPGPDILAGLNALRRRAPGRIRALSPGLPANHPWCEICRFDTCRLRRNSVTRRASLRKAGGGALEARHAALADRNPPEALPDDGGGDARAARHDLVPRLSRLGGPSVARYR